MKGVRKINLTNNWKYFSFTLLLFLVFFILLIKGIVIYTSELEGIIGFNKISIKAKNSLMLNSKNGFTDDDIINLKHRLKDNLILFTLPFKTNIKTLSNNIQVNALAVNTSYNSFTKIKIIKGCFITKKQEENREKVVVIDKNIAYNLFKSLDIIGMNITLMDKKYKIIGITEGSSNILAKQLKRKQPHIYIPLPTIFDSIKNTVVPYFQIAVSDDNELIQKKRNISKILVNMGKTPSNYQIVDHRSFQKKVSQLTLLLSSVIAIYIFSYLIIRQKNILKRVYLIFKNNYQKQYFIQIIKSNWKAIAYLIIQFFFPILSIYIIYRFFEFHLPELRYNYSLYFQDFLINNFFEIGKASTIIESIPCFPEFLIGLIIFGGIPFTAIILLLGYLFLKYH